MSEMETHQGTAPQLPTEVWAAILVKVEDPYDLWVSCRQVSSKFKIDAEHAFRVKLLPKLRIETNYTSTEDPETTMVAKLDETHPDLTSSTDFSEISSYRQHIPDNERLLSLTGALKPPGVVLFNVDGQAPSLVPGDCHLMSFANEKTLTCYISNPNIPALQFHLIGSGVTWGNDASWHEEGHISFDRKKLMTAFFAEESFVRRRLVDEHKPKVTPPTLSQLLEESTCSMSRRCPSMTQSWEQGNRILTMDISDQPRYCCVHSAFLNQVLAALAPKGFDACEDAYRRRLLAAYAKAGKPLPQSDPRSETDIEHPFDNHIRSHVARLQSLKEAKVWGIAAARWEQELGMSRIKTGTRGEGK